MSNIYNFPSTHTLALKNNYNLNEIKKNNKWDNVAQYFKTKYEALKNSDFISRENLQEKLISFLKLPIQGIGEKKNKKPSFEQSRASLKEQISQAKQQLSQTSTQEVGPETIISSTSKGKEKVDDTHTPKAQKNEDPNIRVPFIKEGSLSTQEGQTFLTAKDGTEYLLPSDSSAKAIGTSKTYIGKGKRLLKNKDGHLKEKNKEVAVLIMNKPEDTKELILLKREITTQNTLRKKALRKGTGKILPKCYDAIREGKDLYVFVEPYDLDLKNHLDKITKEKKRLTKEEKLIITRDILKGLNHFHNCHVYHRDIKPANILLQIDQQTGRVTKAALTDCAFACTNQEEFMMQWKCGTPAYISYELIQKPQGWRDPIDEPMLLRNDLWTLGVTLWESILCQPLHLNIRNIKGEKVKVILNKKTRKELSKIYPEPRQKNSIEHIVWELMINPTESTIENSIKKIDRLLVAPQTKLPVVQQTKLLVAPQATNRITREKTHQTK